MSLQLNFLGSLNAISSQDSASGASPPERPASPTICHSGADHAHASLSARQAQAMGLMTIATYGRTGFGSSISNALLQSWASRLQPVTGSLGSTLYALTWKDRITPGGASIFALRASVRPIFASGNICAGWPVALAKDGSAGPDYAIADREGSGGMSLPTTATLAGWVTESARDWKDSEGMATMRPDGSRDRLDQLPRQAMLSGWQAPTSHVLQFVERVPMIKAQLDANISSATAYSWLVWFKQRTGPTIFDWLPPCRRELEIDGDYPVDPNGLAKLHRKPLA